MAGDKVEMGVWGKAAGMREGGGGGTGGVGWGKGGGAVTYLAEVSEDEVQF